jgi:hypothetical protein
MLARHPKIELPHTFGSIAQSACIAYALMLSLSRQPR